MRTIKGEKIKEAIRHAAAEFLSKVSSGISLITVTRVEISRKGDMAVILITAYPETEEVSALAFAKRQLTELRGYIAKNISVHHIPFLSFEIDNGEKNRQRLDELSRES